MLCCRREEPTPYKAVVLKHPARFAYFAAMKFEARRSGGILFIFAFIQAPALADDRRRIVT
jgi:hypothetical protein